MSHELATKASTIPIHSMDDLARLSDMFAKSGYFTDAREAAQIAVKVMAGREMGFGPFASVNGVHVIQGKPAVGANLMAAAVKSSGKYDYRVRQMDNDACKLEFFQGSESLGVSEFSRKDAEAAGTQNLKKFARNMLFARAMSNGVRWYCPDVFMGSSVYTPEELGAAVDAEGEIVDAPHKPAAEPEKPAKGTSAGTAPKGRSKPAEKPQARDMELDDIPPEDDVFPPENKEAPQVRTLSEKKAKGLDEGLRKLGIDDPLALAQQVTGLENIESLMDLNTKEASRVWEVANGGSPEEVPA